MSEASRLQNPEAFEVLSFSLHDTLERIEELKKELLGNTEGQATERRRPEA